MTWEDLFKAIIGISLPIVLLALIIYNIYKMIFLNKEPYRNKIITIIEILTVFKLIRDILKEKK